MHVLDVDLHMSRINTHTNISVVLKDRLPPPIRDRRSLLAYRSVGWLASLPHLATICLWPGTYIQILLGTHTTNTHTHPSAWRQLQQCSSSFFVVFFFSVCHDKIASLQVELHYYFTSEVEDVEYLSVPNVGSGCA